MSLAHPGLPWTKLTNHIRFSAHGTLELQPNSNPQERHISCTFFAKAFARRIMEFADGQIRRLPRLGSETAAEEWQHLGISPDRVFPDDILRSPASGAFEMLPDPNIASWEVISRESSYEAQFVAFLLSGSHGSFAYLPNLIYLARSPRINMSSLRAVYTSGNGNPGVDPFVEWVLKNYLFINILLGMDDGRSIRDRRIRILPWYRRHQHEWLTLTTRPKAEDLLFSNEMDSCDWSNRDAISPLQTYSRRYFGIIAAAHAWMREAHERDIAVLVPGAQKVKVNDEDTLSKWILRALDDVDPVFRSWRSMSVPVAVLGFSPPTPAPRSNDCVEKSVTMNHKSSGKRGPSYFLRLPTEVLYHIGEHVHPHSPFTLVLVCKRFNSIFTDVIYRDPLRRTVEPYLLLSSHQVERLLETLTENPHLLRRLRCLYVTRDEKSARSQRERALPLKLALDPRLLDLNRLDFVVHLDSDLAPSSIFEVTDALSRIGRRWPNLKALNLVVWTYAFTPNDSPSFSFDATGFPSSLTDLLIDSRVMGKIWTPLIINSSESLLSLTIELSDDFLGIGRELPIFPRLTSLSISLEARCDDLPLILARSFPRLTDLTFLTRDHWPMHDKYLDLELCAPLLRHLSAMVPSCNISNYPPLLKSLALRCKREWQLGPGQIAWDHHLPSKQLEEMEAILVDCDMMVLSQVVPIIGKRCPNLRSLELDNTLGVRESDLPDLANMLSIHLPQLEILICTVEALSNRPYRMDFPAPDGLDEIMQQHAERFFTTARRAHANLRVISFNGIPPTWEVPAKFPPRVWVIKEDFIEEDSTGTRTTSSFYECKMAGRAELPWLLSVYRSGGWEHLFW